MFTQTTERASTNAPTPTGTDQFSGRTWGKLEEEEERLPPVPGAEPKTLLTPSPPSDQNPAIASSRFSLEELPDNEPEHSRLSSPPRHQNPAMASRSSRLKRLLANIPKYKLFNKATQLNDVASVGNTAASMSNKVAAAVSGVGFLAKEIASALPIASLAIGGVGVAESVTRGVIANKNKKALNISVEKVSNPKLKAILTAAVQEQKREVVRRKGRAGLGIAETGLLIAGVAVGAAATAGAGLIIAASVIGGIKGLETLYNFYRKRKGKKLSKQYAERLLNAARRGNRGVKDALRELGVQHDNLDGDEAFKAATGKLATLMSKTNKDVFEKTNTFIGDVEANRIKKRKKRREHKTIRHDQVAIDRLKRMQMLQHSPSPPSHHNATASPRRRKLKPIEHQ